MSTPQRLPATFRACVPQAYGEPSEQTLKIVTIPTPTKLSGGQALVKIHYASLNGGDMHLVNGTPCVLRCVFGLRKPKLAALGSDFSGEIVQLGAGVLDWKVGDRVFGDLSDTGKCGALSEYQVIDKKWLARIPENVSYRDAACLPVAGTTALSSLKAVEATAGDTVLVVGASGGVGHFAVQIAKHALRCEHVTGVCSGRSVEIVKSLGADEVIDYQKEGNYFEDGPNGIDKYRARFDVILDCANDKTASNNAKKAVRCLTPGGRYLMVGGKDLMSTMCCAGRYAGAAGEGRTARVHLSKASAELCGELAALVAEGSVKAWVDEESGAFALGDAVSGMEIMNSGRARGKILIEVSQA